LVTPKPYNDIQLDEKTYVRTFNNDLNESELVWHRDKKDRSVRVIDGEGWQFQFDDKLPFTLEHSQSYYVPKDVYHRVIAGSSQLVLEITESGDNNDNRK